MPITTEDLRHDAKLLDLFHAMTRLKNPVLKDCAAERRRRHDDDDSTDEISEPLFAGDIVRELIARWR